MIDVARSTGLLSRAAREFFNEGYELAEAEKILKHTAAEQQAEARGSLLPRRTVPDGCFVWIGYLIWLERALEIVDVPLLGVEVEGLLVLKRERNRFQAAHPPCPHCGMPNESHALRCRECMKEIG